MKYQHFLLLALPLTFANAEQQDLRILTGILHTIFSKIFYPKGISVSIISDYNKNHFITDVIDDLLWYNAKQDPVPISINQYTTPKIDKFIGVKLIIAQRVKEIEMALKSSSAFDEIQTTPSKFIIILNNRKYRAADMRKIFELFFDSYILDVVILIGQRTKVDMYTFYPFSRKHCSSLRPILMRSFRQIPQYLNYSDLFPAKNKNFYQCPMNVVLWSLPPFMELIRHDNGTISYEGFDASILSAIAGALNFSVELMPNEPPEFISGTIYNNKTAVGVFKMLLERRANLTLGCIACLPNRVQMTSASMQYFIPQYVIALRNSVVITPFELLLKPFQSSTWWLLVVAVLLKATLERVCRRKLRIRRNFRNLFSLQWIYFLFLLRIAYEGSMFKVITSPPYQPLPQTIESLIDLNYTIITDYATVRVLENIPAVQQITQVVKGSPSEVMQQIDHLPEKTGILLSSSFVAHFVKTRLQHHNKYTLLREKLSNGLNCIYYPKSSFLVAPVNDILSRLISFGVKQRFANEIGLNKLPLTTDKWLNKRRSHEGSVLDFTFLQVVFKGLIILHACSFVVFLLEIASFRLRRKYYNRKI